MRSEITDPHATTTINPFDLASYLHAGSWRRGSAISEGRARMIEALPTGNPRRYPADIIRWRIIQDDSSDGTIPLEDGQLFITQVRSQLFAAATEYMRNARLGQSERGSYVVTVPCQQSWG